MSAFGFGTQSDWYAAGMLLMQLAFWGAGVWFARNFLKTIRGFQEQVGALVKLSVTSAPAEPHSASTIARHTLGEISTNVSVSPRHVEETRVHTEVRTPRVEANTYRILAAEAPVAMARSAQEQVESDGVGSLQRIGQWLRGPLHTSEVSPDATGLRRMIQWLGAPAGS